MKIPRFVTSLRALMLAILAIGVLLAIVAYRRDRERRRIATEAQVLLQSEVTSRLRQEIEPEAIHFIDSLLRPSEDFNFASGGGSHSNMTEWEVDYEITSYVGGKNRVVLDLDIRGGSDGVSLRPISIQNRPGELNGRFFERLIKEYREKGWPYRFVPATPRPTTSR